MSGQTIYKKGLAELADVRAKGRSLYLSVFVFSIFVNLLMLTGPLFMLQVYDRVLGSRSEATLVALFVLVAVLYLLMGFLDYARGRVLARAGARFQATLDRRVFEAVLRRSVVPEERNRPATGLRDLESVQRLLSSPVLLAVCDIPWTPLFIAAIFFFHPYLGFLGLFGGAVLISITFINQWLTREPVKEANMATGAADAFAEHVRENGELVQGLGMRDSVLARWRTSRDKALAAQISSSDKTGTFSTASKTFRFFLQSAMLGLGAWLVLQGKLTPGAMIAGSILLGRALAPIEQAIGQWPLVERARQGWTSLSELLEKTPVEDDRTELPRPRAILEAQQVTVVPPGEQAATLRMLSFRLEPGQALGVIGPSAAGKSTLARVITGIWRPASGKVRLDGASLEQYGQALGNHIGYLPQDVALFNGSVAENIARMSTEPDPQKVVEAAKKAGAHDMILKLPDGYDTRITAGGGRLSGGQKQRLGLARAMYGDPMILVLDEPNSNLDSQGSEALNSAIRQMKSEGKSVIIMAHRPAAIAECDLLLVVEGGMRKAFGPRDEVLKEQLKNYNQVAGALQPGAGTGVPQPQPQPAAMKANIPGNPIMPGGMPMGMPNAMPPAMPKPAAGGELSVGQPFVAPSQGSGPSAPPARPVVQPAPTPSPAKVDTPSKPTGDVKVEAKPAPTPDIKDRKPEPAVAANGPATDVAEKIEAKKTAEPAGDTAFTAPRRRLRGSLADLAARVTEAKSPGDKSTETAEGKGANSEEKA